MVAWACPGDQGYDDRSNHEPKRDPEQNPESADQGAEARLDGREQMTE